MLYEVLLANVKNLIDTRVTDDEREHTPNNIFQITVGKKNDVRGWHFRVKDGVWEFKRGLFTGDIIIDWNDEYKYKDKSRKQVKKETLPDYSIDFKTEEKFEEFINSYKAGAKKIAPPRGHKLSGNKVDASFFLSMLTEAIALQVDDTVQGQDETVSRLMLYTVPATINELGKTGDTLICEFLKTDRRSYFFEVKGQPSVSTWCTAQSGTSKVTANQSTRLAAFFGLSFADFSDCHKFFFGNKETRMSMYDSVVEFRGKSTYSSNVCEADARKIFIDVVEYAVSR